MDNAFSTAEQAARKSYGRLIAILASRTRDIAAAEDALADAFTAALSSWPQKGIPAQPEAWLLTTARRKLIDRQRHEKIIDTAIPELRLLTEQLTVLEEKASIPDERLRLLFTCAHPAIDAAARTPLMLQTVLGIDVKRMASVFITSPATLAQRLVRAKAKIRQAGIPFTEPELQDLPERLQYVMDAIYAAFGTGWEDVTGSDSGSEDLALASIELARFLCQQLPAQAEPKGLLALLLFCEARRAARRSSTGLYVPLDRHDTSLWNHGLIEEAEGLLASAVRMNMIGPYQLEAAIQSAHTQRLLGAAVPAAAIAQLYQGLLVLRPRVGTIVSYACALAAAQDAAAGLAVLDEIEPELQARYQPYWAARAALLRAAGDEAEAQEAYTKAIGLSESEAVRSFLIKTRQEKQ